MPTFTMDHDTDDEVLGCPSCGEANGLHLDMAVVDAYAKEDHPTAVLATASDGATHVLPSGTAPRGGSRRHGLGLAGWCELCGKQFLLWFRQHKGQTIASFIELEEDSPFASRPD